MNYNKLKLLLTEDIEKTISELIELVDTDLPLFDRLIMAKARYSDLNRDSDVGLYSTIDRNVETNKIRGNILFVINELAKAEKLNRDSNIVEIISNEDLQNIDSNSGEDGDLGLWDLEELFLDSSHELRDSMERMTDDISELGEKMKEDANSINQLAASKPTRNSLKGILSKTSRSMVSYGKRLEVEVPIFRRTTEDTIKYMLQYIEKLYEYGIDTEEGLVHKFSDSTEKLISTSRNSRNSLLGMYEEIKKIPGMTAEFNRAKRKVLKELDNFFNDYNSFLNNLGLLKNNIDGMLIELIQD